MKRILLVEDTPDLLTNITDVLTMEGFDVIPSKDGVEALEKLSAAIPDLIITDILMPRMDGFTLIETLKANKDFKKIPVLIFSAKATKENEDQGLLSGAIQYLKKPCPTDYLLKIIHNLITEKDCNDKDTLG
jgi:DNA-binding response OmpR family regulator